MRHKLRLISRCLNFLIIVFALALFFSYRKINSFPPARNILPNLTAEPVQTDSNVRPFTFTYEGSSYQIFPRANYNIRGLVVTHNNISGIGDMYHTSKSVDLKDLCLIWGENASSPYLKEIQFWSEPWTCNFYTKNQEAYSSFQQDRLSNNHVLASTPEVRRIIESVKIGDQIEMRGMLVDYHPQGASELLRKTSLIRTDTGNGACEVLYVESIRILEEWLPFYSKLFSKSKYALIFLLIIRLLTFLLFPYLEYRSINIDFPDKATRLSKYRK